MQEEVAVVEETPAAKDAREGTIYGQVEFLKHQINTTFGL